MSDATEGRYWTTHPSKLKPSEVWEGLSDGLFLLADPERYHALAWWTATTLLEEISLTVEVKGVGFGPLGGGRRLKKGMQGRIRESAISFVRLCASGLAGWSPRSQTDLANLLEQDLIRKHVRGHGDLLGVIGALLCVRGGWWTVEQAPPQGSFFGGVA